MGKASKQIKGHCQPVARPGDKTKNRIFFQAHTTPQAECPECKGNPTICRQILRQKATRRKAYFLEWDGNGWVLIPDENISTIDHIRYSLWILSNEFRDHPDVTLRNVATQADHALKQIETYVTDIQKLTLQPDNTWTAQISWEAHTTPEANEALKQALNLWQLLYEAPEQRNAPPPPTLFPNLDPNQNLGLPRQFADNYAAAMRYLIEGKNIIMKNYNYKPNVVKYKVGARDVEIRLGLMENPDDDVRLHSFDVFYDRILRIRDAKIIQTLAALFDYAAQNGRWQFRNVSLNDVMKLVLKAPKNGHFSQPEKRKFTEVLIFLNQLQITLDTDIYEPEKGGKKSASKKVARHYYRVLELEVSVHARGRDGSVDESVILRFNGELLPRFNKGIAPARLYGRGLLHYDANKDRTTILLSFLIQTRLSQINQTRTSKTGLSPCSIQRGQLVELAGYTEQPHTRAQINGKLRKIFDKLIESGDIERYEPTPLPLNDNSAITFYPVDRPNLT